MYFLYETRTKARDDGVIIKMLKNTAKISIVSMLGNLNEREDKRTKHSNRCGATIELIGCTIRRVQQSIKSRILLSTIDQG